MSVAERKAKPIKILHVISVDKENYYLNNLADFSDAGEVEFSFVTLAPEGCDFVADMRSRGRRVYGLDAMARSRYPRAYRDLARLMRELEPDIVHTHLFDPSVIGLTVAKRQRRKTVLTRHHSDAIHEIPSALKRRFYLGLENYVSRKADHIIAPSRMVREFLVEQEGVASEKVSVIPYGQTTERFDAVTPDKIETVRTELGMNGTLALVCVSRLFYRKGHKYLFEAYAGLKRNGLNAKLYLVGDGDHRAELERAAVELGISDDVRFLGWRDDALAIMAAADVIVHPSLEDALSSAVIESLMLERPIVATDISGVRDSLDDGKYGKIVAPADAEGFRRGLKEIVDNLDTARARAKEGRKYLLDYMDARRVSLAYTDIYNKVMGLES
jgi:glycosyltransferase involved in cell wall biosynthesis